MSGPARHVPVNHVNNSSPELATRSATTSLSRSSTFEESPAQSDAERTSRANTQEIPTSQRVRSLRRRRDRSRRQKEPEVWKKILWVKQSYPDNYTDPPTFLSHLQWNPLVVPYDFWPLVADSTVIVQHVCSVIIFICCFIGIYQERVSPISVVGWGSTFTFICWLLWDAWIGLEERQRSHSKETQQQGSASHNSPRKPVEDEPVPNALGLSVPRTSSAHVSRSPSPTQSIASMGTTHTPSLPYQSDTSIFPTHNYIPPYNAPGSVFSTRWQQRLATAKSAILIYCALLGLSPILKSLTISTTSDSIWAMSTWLLLINVFFYDYGGDGTDNNNSSISTSDNTGTMKYQSSLSTNAALMASTVLASRLTSTTHVFSLTLFSIEVFGLFPVFRRQLRQHSWQLHVSLTILLILAAGAGLGIVLADPISHNSNNDKNDGTLTNTEQAYVSVSQYLLSCLFAKWNWNWKAALTGAMLWSLVNILAMGGCSWWLISLQKYKNVVIGPWDPAKPIVRRGPAVEMGGYG